MKHQYIPSAAADAESYSVAPLRSHRSLYEKYGKRALDLALAVSMLPVLLPVISVLWVLVRRDGANGFFGHKRIGQNGHEFYCYKIRTMVPNAEGKLQAYLDGNPEAAEEWEKTQKLTDDPRITAIGKFLRKTSLDELPQIWNVLRGEMSFVGPRPVTEPELERYGPQKRSYLSMRPGITGLWQVEGRGDGDYVERVQMDSRYSDQLSWKYDLALIARTALVVVRPTGR